jgi:threonine aldolase
MDGARLGSGIMSSDYDLDLNKITDCVDMYYIGGTKNGALLGEAIVIVNEILKEEFRYHLKQRGALLAKGRLLGLQFKTLFEDNLYFDLTSHANQMAAKLTTGIEKLGIGFLTKSTTNQIFPILSNKTIEELSKLYGFYVWSKVGDQNSSIRLVTSWATKEEMVNEFLSDLRQLIEKN